MKHVTGGDKTNVLAFAQNLVPACLERIFGAYYRAFVSARQRALIAAAIEVGHQFRDLVATHRIGGEEISQSPAGR